MEKRGGVVGSAPARRVGNAVRGSAAKAAAGDFKMNVNSAHREARVIVLICNHTEFLCTLTTEGYASEGFKFPGLIFNFVWAPILKMWGPKKGLT